jgi:hypothetical protein
MKAAILYGPRDVRFQKRGMREIVAPRVQSSGHQPLCLCGSDLWSYCSLTPIHRPGRLARRDAGIRISVPYRQASGVQKTE